MTLKEAKSAFGFLMAVSKQRKLGPAETAELRKASQVIRYAKRTTAANKGNRSRRTAKPVRQSSRSGVDRPYSNPRGTTLIYDKVTRIEAQKGKSSSYPGQKFFHNFKRPYPKMYGLPDGGLLIK